MCSIGIRTKKIGIDSSDIRVYNSKLIMGTRADCFERDNRYKRLREQMVSERLDAVILAGTGGHFNRGHIRYFSDCHSWAGDAMILLPLSGDPVMAWVTYAGIGFPEQPWIDDVRRTPFPPKQIIAALNEKNLTRGRIGIAGMARLVSIDAYQMLCSNLPDVEFVNADLMASRVRSVKSQLELLQYQEVWQLSVRAMQTFFEIAEPGVTEREAAAAAARVLRAGGSWEDLTIVQHEDFAGLARDVLVRRNEMFSLHLEICGESGHWTEIDGTVALREPTQIELRLMDAELRVYDEIRRIARPGILLSELACKYDHLLVEEGWELRPPGWHFYFHGHGFDDIEWPWYTARLEDNRDTVLETGMVLNYHPHRDTNPTVHRPTRITDDLLITDQGGVRLSGDWDLRWRVK